MKLVRTVYHGKKGDSECVLLRRSFREGGKVGNRTIANLSHCTPGEIAAIELALRHKDNLAALGSVAEDVQLREGPSVGAVWTLGEVARRLGIDRALGSDRQGRLALWQVIARAVGQGSRLSAVRLARSHAALEVLGLESAFDEDDLYANLAWLDDNQAAIEDALFRARYGGGARPELFLYDVTSSYLEGECNELADWGYNRDRKRGKKQIVIGLLCDGEGAPLCVEVFRGNTGDVSTFASQVGKVAGRFGCRRVTFVGDRGMIKRAGIDELRAHGFHHITAITKPQIEALVRGGVLQLDMFDEPLIEVEHEGTRYVVRRNPQRARETADTRADKQRRIERLMADRNAHLAGHPRASVQAALAALAGRIARLAAGAWLRVRADGRTLCLEVNEQALAQAARLDGCYAITTDLPVSAADARTIHERYKDLIEVEDAFRTCKTGHLEVRPIFVRSEQSTRGHVLVVMLAYLLVRELARLWRDVDITVEEAIAQLATLSAMTVTVEKVGVEVHKLPKPRDLSARLLEAAGITLPEFLPKRTADVVTKKSLAKARQHA